MRFRELVAGFTTVYRINNAGSRTAHGSVVDFAH